MDFNSLPDHRPIKAPSKQIGEVASAHLALYFKKLGWIYRSQEDQNDFGIDAEVELVDKNLVTGTVMKCQVKGCESLEWKIDSASVRVKRSTFDYWCNYGVPVIAFLVDNPLGAIYWSLPIAHSAVPGEKTVQIVFSRKNLLSDDGSTIASIARSWHQTFSPYNILTEVPHFHRLHKKLLELVDWGDKWMPIDDELDTEARLYYKHVIQLRLSVGLTSSIIPLDDFYIRNAEIWDGDRQLFHGTFSELIQYLAGFYEEALLEVKRRLKDVPLCFENREVINYFRLDPLFNRSEKLVDIQYHDPRRKDPSFHAAIEEQLRARKALRACWSKKEIY